MNAIKIESLQDVYAVALEVHQDLESGNDIVGIRIDAVLRHLSTRTHIPAVEFGALTDAFRNLTLRRASVALAWLLSHETHEDKIVLWNKVSVIINDELATLKKLEIRNAAKASRAAAIVAA
jgi:hypothetical protein